MSDLKFSVIKIFDNDILTIDEFITSMIDQKLDFKKNIELILIDLGSVDHSNAILSDYQLKFPDKIKLYNSNDKFDAYNLALKKSNGDYIHFCKKQLFSNRNQLSDMFNHISKNGDEADIFIFENHVTKNKYEFKTKID